MRPNRSTRKLYPMSHQPRLWVWKAKMPRIRAGACGGGERWAFAVWATPAALTPGSRSGWHGIRLSSAPQALRGTMEGAPTDAVELSVAAESALDVVVAAGAASTTVTARSGGTEPSR